MMKDHKSILLIKNKIGWMRIHIKIYTHEYICVCMYIPVYMLQWFSKTFSGEGLRDTLQIIFQINSPLVERSLKISRSSTDLQGPFYLRGIDSKKRDNVFVL
jgi:hypothetical protein